MKENYIKLKNNLNDRNIAYKYCDSRKVLNDVIAELTKPYKKIGIGNSQTLKSIGISQELIASGKIVYDKTLATNPSEVKELKKLALMSECYISSTNALAMTGEIVNVDHSGNRVAAMTYGPEKVIIVVSSNKIVDNESNAIRRALNVATPRNAQRAKIKSPCSTGEPCSECTQDTRVCNYLSIIRGQNEKNRMIVLLIDEELGF